MDAKKFIRIGNNRSPIIISDEPEKDFKRWWQLKIGTHKQTPVVVLVDTNVYSSHRKTIDQLISSIPVSVSDTFELSGGEGCKQFSAIGPILADWIEKPLNRDTVVICIGGGAITDLGGFLAAIYKRGLRTVYLPTSLMAMTDASLGGKNAVNFGVAKNQLGTIHFPEFTFITMQWLTSLPPQEMRSGFAEIMKHAVLDSRNFINTMLAQTNIESAPAKSLLMRSIRVKMKIVAGDPYEKSGRMWLNLGHSFGHAFESYYSSSDKPVSHGHAVAMGLAEELFFSVKLCGFSASLAADISKWLRAGFLFEALPAWDAIQSYIVKDKKNVAEGIRLVLLKSPGNPSLMVVSAEKCCTLHHEFVAQL